MHAVALLHAFADQAGHLTYIASVCLQTSVYGKTECIILRKIGPMVCMTAACCEVLHSNAACMLTWLPSMPLPSTIQPNLPPF